MMSAVESFRADYLLPCEEDRGTPSLVLVVMLIIVVTERSYDLQRKSE
jgi:hypothetical protein